jgi:hypothetical protein
MNPPAQHQRGHVALLLALSIVIAASVVSAGVVEVGISDSRRIAQELRRLEAQAAAEDALDRAALWLRLNASRIRDADAGGWMEPGRVRWRVCGETAPRAPCTADDSGERETFDAHWSAYGPLPHLFAPTESGALHSTAWYLARAERYGEPMPGWATLHAIAEGRSRDGTALARLRRSFQLRPLLRRLPESPVAVTGVANVGVGVSILAPEGVPVQIVGADGDTSSRLFGPAGADALRASAQMLDDCATLGPGSHGLLWIRGDCTLATGGAIGSAAAPVILVVDSGTAHVEGPAELFGILVLRGGNTSLQQSNDTFALHGALMADGDLELAAESLSIQYEPDVLQPLLQLAGPLIEVAGSWTDHR